MASPADTSQLGADSDGLPKTDRGPKDLPKKADGTPDIDAEDKPDAAALALKKAEEDLGAKWQEERKQLQRAAEDRAKEAQAAIDRAAEFERKARVAEDTVSKTNDMSLRVHAAKVQADYQSITSSISAWESAAANAERDYVTASEAGDHANAAKANRAIAHAASVIGQLEAGKAGAEAEIERVKAAYSARTSEPEVKDEPKPEKKPDPTPAKQTPEDWIAGIRSNVGDKVADWLDKNREFVTNQDLNNQVLAFANLHAARRKPLNSDDFISKLNAEFLEEDTTVADEDEPVVATKAEKTRAKATPAAPVSRGGGYFSSHNPDAQKIRAPKDIVEFCKRAGLDVTSYVLAARDEIKRGDKPKEWLDPDYDRGIR